MSNNMYRVGDCVYFETNSTLPYQIRRIEEICKTASGTVEAKVMCFYRRRDIPQNLVSLADKHQIGGSEEENGTVVVAAKEELSDKQKHQLRHRELFLSRQVETLPATHIRGKCTITLLNETEYFSSYLNKEDMFFYSLVYDPQNKTLLADRGEIRVGPRFQAEPTPLLKKNESDGRSLEDLETLIWDPINPLNDKHIENFLIVARSVGTFARSLDCSSTVRQPSLHMSAAAASRDITLFTAMNLLHKHNYSVPDAMLDLIPLTGPVLCRDEMEEWSASEANLFEEALDKYGRDFIEIRNDFLPWKSLKSIVEYYYMWKTTDRYVQQKRIKAAEAESKLKQVYIPTYNKPNPSQTNDKSDKLCESCFASTSNQWYTWGPAVLQCRVCALCWVYWKKYGGLKMPTRLDNSGSHHGNNGEKQNQPATPPKPFKCTVQGCSKSDFRTKAALMQHISSVHGLPVRAGSPCPVMKTRAAFCLITTPLTKASRQICKNILDIRRACRRPFQPINIALIKQECQQKMPDLVNAQRSLKKKIRVNMEKVSARLGIDVKMEKPALLHRDNSATDKRASIGGDVKPRPPLPTHQQSSKKRSHDSNNGDEDIEPPNKIPAVTARAPSNIKPMMPKMRGSTMNRMNGSNSKALNRMRNHSLNLNDNFEDIYLVVTETLRRLRKQVSTAELKRCGRNPWRNMPTGNSTLPTSNVVVLD